MVFNHDREQTRDAVLHVDLDGLGLAPERTWQEFIRVGALDKPEDEAAAALDDVADSFGLVEVGGEALATRNAKRELEELVPRDEWILFATRLIWASVLGERTSSNVAFLGVILTIFTGFAMGIYVYFALSAFHPKIKPLEECPPTGLHTVRVGAILIVQV